ncbi:MAG: bifunctional 4-hydroxy-2-oxoglutarate aldolase/2-dehydro-3-deoxy-phosphogluconate aldolase [Pseudomonadota bacterium]
MLNGVQNKMDLDTILQKGPVIPVVTLHDAAHGVPLAHALLQGGIKVMEITLRCDSGLDAIKAIRHHVPAMIVGAGTVLDVHQFADALAAGAQFIVSPGATGTLLAAAHHHDKPFLPGAATVSEMMHLGEAGFHSIKLFPAAALGGIALLKSLQAPLPHLRFCPTGGIDASQAAHWLDVANVVCIGGSWITPHALIAAGRYEDITGLAHAATKLRTSHAAS